MTLTGTWETVRRQVAISGRVLDEQGNGMAGVRVDVVGAPKRLQLSWDNVSADVPGWSSMDHRPGRTTTVRDGFFHFLDLPEGSYRLQAKVLNRTSLWSAQADVGIVWNPGGRVNRVHTDLVLRIDDSQSSDHSSM